MEPVRLAEVGEDAIVIRVILCPPGSGPDFATTALGLPGVWVVDTTAEASPMSVYVEETGEFFAIDDEEVPE